MLGIITSWALKKGCSVAWQFCDLLCLARCWFLSVCNESVCKSNNTTYRLFCGLADDVTHCTDILALCSGGHLKTMCMLVSSVCVKSCCEAHLLSLTADFALMDGVICGQVLAVSVSARLCTGRARGFRSFRCLHPLLLAGHYCHTCYSLDFSVRRLQHNVGGCLCKSLQ